MATVTYIGDPKKQNHVASGGPDGENRGVVRFRGYEFRANEPTDVPDSDELTLAKLRDNRHFEVGDGKAAPVTDGVPPNDEERKADFLNRDPQTMTKPELLEMGKLFGVELDAASKKADLIDQLKAALHGDEG